MTRKTLFLRLFMVFIAVVCGVGFVSWFLVERRLNVILITLDTTRADHLGCYGYHTAETPTIDALAKRGVVFQHAYTTVPLTLPAHASIHTGLYPFESSLITNGVNGLPDKVQTLAQPLAANGYATGAFVASEVLNRKYGLDRGFEVYDDDMGITPRAAGKFEKNVERSADVVIASALSWLGVQQKKPFFCWVHLFDPHHVYVDHQASFGKQFIDRPYDGEIAFVDLHLKRLIDFLESRQLTKRTMIVVVGDHGEGLSEHHEKWHRYMLYNSTLHVPLIVCMPSKAQAQRLVPESVSVIDIVPTVLDCLGIKSPPNISGRSLEPALRGGTLPAKACYAATSEAFLEEGWSPLSCLITDKWKYIHTTKRELYDLQKDPGETLNLAESQKEKMLEFEQQLVDVELGGVRYESHPVAMSEQEIKRLQSIGYLEKVNPQKASEENLPDIKEMIDQLDTFQGILEFYARGEFEAMIRPLYELIKTAPRYREPRLLLAQTLMARKETEAAEEQYLAILDIDADDYQSNSNLGIILANRGDLKHALPYLLKAIKARPNSANLNLNVGRILTTLNLPGAEIYLRAGEKLMKLENAGRSIQKP